MTQLYFTMLLVYFIGLCLEPPLYFLLPVKMKVKMQDNNSKHEKKKIMYPSMILD